MESHTLKAGRVVFPFAGITTILSMGGLAKIVPSIIGSITVSMVNFIQRPCAGYINPCNSVRFE